MAFSDVLQYYRKKKKLSQKELARAVGIGDRAVSHYELGRSFPTLDVAYRIGCYLGISLDSFFYDPLGVGGIDPENPYDYGWKLNSHILLNYIRGMYDSPEFSLRGRQKFLNTVIEIYLLTEGLVVRVESGNKQSLDENEPGILENLNELELPETDICYTTSRNEFLSLDVEID